MFSPSFSSIDKTEIPFLKEILIYFILVWSSLAESSCMHQANHWLQKSDIELGNHSLLSYAQGMGLSNAAHVHGNYPKPQQSQ